MLWRPCPFLTCTPLLGTAHALSALSQPAALPPFPQGKLQYIKHNFNQAACVCRQFPGPQLLRVAYCSIDTAGCWPQLLRVAYCSIDTAGCWPQLLQVAYCSIDTAGCGPQLLRVACCSIDTAGCWPDVPNQADLTCVSADTCNSTARARVVVCLLWAQWDAAASATGVANPGHLYWDFSCNPMLWQLQASRNGVASSLGLPSCSCSE